MCRPIAFLFALFFLAQPIMTMQKEALSKFGLEAAREALKLLKASEDPHLPVIIHSFSGGGCVVLEQLEILIMAAKQAQSRTLLQEDLVLLDQAIKRGGEVFDSCPAYLHISSGLKAIQSGVPNTVLRLVIQLIFLLLTVLLTTISIIKGESGGPEAHWSHLKSSDVANRQAYIYSTADEITDHTKLDEMAECRKQRAESIVLVKRFTDSHHCQHLLKHKTEYQAILDDFFGSIKDQQREIEILDQDPDMTDYQMGMD